MEHENTDQQEVTLDLDDGTHPTVYVSFCSCGDAFWDRQSDVAYEIWEQHEADAS